MGRAEKKENAGVIVKEAHAQGRPKKVGEGKKE